MVVPHVMHSTRGFQGFSSVQIGRISQDAVRLAAPCETSRTIGHGQNTDNHVARRQTPVVIRGLAAFRSSQVAGFRCGMIRMATRESAVARDHPWYKPEPVAWCGLPPETAKRNQEIPEHFVSRIGCQGWSCLTCPMHRHDEGILR